MPAISLESFCSDLDKIHEESLVELKALKSGVELEEFRVRIFGKKGRLTEKLKELKDVPKDKKSDAGKKAHQIKSSLNDEFSKLKEKILQKELNEELASEKINLSLPGRVNFESSLHPVTNVENELVSIFKSFGFTVEIGPEAETEFHNFDALNIPKNHPSRTMQDTFYLDVSSLLLRTHTSPVQIRTMLSQEAPIRMICPGRVYRSDYDQTHSPMFHQLEGLVIDQDVFMGDLKGILEAMFERFFNSQMELRFRPSYFPFTEPSAEVDMECIFCKNSSSSSCSVCRGSGWIEIGGCGMVDPEVLKAVDYDTESLRGFAFGMGIERMTMLKYGVSDLRSFYESDNKFLKQFSEQGI